MVFWQNFHIGKGRKCISVFISCTFLSEKRKSLSEKHGAALNGEISAGRNEDFCFQLIKMQYFSEPFLAVCETFQFALIVANTECLLESCNFHISITPTLLPA